LVAAIRESKEKAVAWGEIGLDYHYNLSDPQVQRSVFARQIKKAVELGLPLVIHTREAEEGKKLTNVKAIYSFIFYSILLIFHSHSKSNKF
jgi:Tat protein secretion system quality control protein TatD with DNase activity